MSWLCCINRCETKFWVSRIWSSSPGESLKNCGKCELCCCIFLHNSWSSWSLFLQVLVLNIHASQLKPSCAKIILEFQEGAREIEILLCRWKIRAMPFSAFPSAIHERLPVLKLLVCLCCLRSVRSEHMASTLRTFLWSILFFFFRSLATRH